MSQLLLPKLSSEKSVIAAPNHIGMWDRREANTMSLHNVAESLDVPDSKFDVNSIPSVWARPILFQMQMSLYSSGKPLHEQHGVTQRIIGEWRGLLAVLALRARYRYAVTIQPIELDDEDYVGASRGFVNALKQLAPEAKLSDGMNWNDLFVIMYDSGHGKKAIGMMSPSTLVCTSTSTYANLHGIPWTDAARYLSDPTQRLNNTDRHLLAKWLEDLKARISALSGDVNLRDDLNQALDGFISELYAGIPASTPDQKLKDAPLLRFGGSPFDSLLADAIGEPEWTADASHTRLMPSHDFAPKPLIIVDGNETDGSLTETGEKAQDIIVFGAVPLSRFRSAMSKSLKLNDNEKIDIRSADELFMDKLVLIEQADAFPGSVGMPGANNLKIGTGDVTPLLPIKPILLNYLSADDIQKAVSFAEVKRGEYIVSLKLRLSGADNKGSKTVTYTKKYGSGDIVLRTNVPLIAIWPKFSTESWKAYYTHYSAEGQDSDTTFMIRPYPDDETVVQEYPNKRSTFKTTNFPRAFICDITEGGRVQEGGLIILKPEEVGRSPGKTVWNVGVDFGTSSTHVYFNDIPESTDSVHNLEFSDFLLDISRDTGLASGLSDTFIPHAINLPFLSLYQDLVGDKDIEKTLLQGRIYYIDDQNYSGLKDTVSSLYTDMKWNIDDAGVGTPLDRIKLYFLQLAKQIAAEAKYTGVSEISWRFAFPTAFTSMEAEHLKNIAWRTIVNVIPEITGIACSAKYTSESVAGASYFSIRDGAAFHTRSVITMDIGGGSTDIAIWQKKDIKFQTSLFFAGRHIFLDLFRKKPSVLNHFSNDQSSDMDAQNITRPDGFYAFMSAFLARSGDQILEKLPLKFGEPLIQQLQWLITFSLSGIAYYVGLIYGHLIESGVLESEIPQICLAGNGSRAIDWMRDEKVLSDIFLDAANLESDEPVELKKPNFKVDGYKPEVAYGLAATEHLLLELDDHADKINVVKPQFIAGEGHFIEGVEAPSSWHESLYSSTHKAGIQVRKLDNMRAFKDSFDRHFRIKGVEGFKFTDRVENSIVEKINVELVTQKKNKEDKIRVEPLFIIALRSVLSHFLDEWAKSGTK